MIQASPKQESKKNLSFIANVGKLVGLGAASSTAVEKVASTIYEDETSGKEKENNQEISRTNTQSSARFRDGCKILLQHEINEAAAAAEEEEELLKLKTQ